MSGELFHSDGSRKYLTQEERAAFLDASRRFPRDVETFCHVLAYTGCRLTEALALTAYRVDLTAHRMTFETLKKRKRGVFRAVPLPPEFAVMLDHVHDLRRSQRRKDRRPTRPHVGVVAGDGLAQRRIKSTSPEKACLVRYNTERNVRPNPWGSRAAPDPESALPPSTARYAPLARQSPSPVLPAGAGRLPCPSDRR